MMEHLRAIAIINATAQESGKSESYPLFDADQCQYYCQTCANRCSLAHHLAWLRPLAGA